MVFEGATARRRGPRPSRGPQRDGDGGKNGPPRHIRAKMAQKTVPEGITARRCRPQRSPRAPWVRRWGRRRSARAQRRGWGLRNGFCGRNGAWSGRAERLRLACGTARRTELREGRDCEKDGTASGRTLKCILRFHSRGISMDVRSSECEKKTRRQRDLFPPFKTETAPAPGEHTRPRVSLAAPSQPASGRAPRLRSIRTPCHAGFPRGRGKPHPRWVRSPATFGVRANHSSLMPSFLFGKRTTPHRS